MIRVNSYVPPEELKDLEEQLEELSKEKEEAINTQNYEKAAKIRDKERQLKQELKSNKAQWEHKKEVSNLIVGYDEIAKVVSDWSGVPVTKMTTEESQRLLDLEKYYMKRLLANIKL